MIQLMDIEAIQGKLHDYGIDGWLIYDHQGANRFALQLLNLPAKSMTTRRIFYFIPASGEPTKIVHKIEAHSLDHMPGQTLLYTSWVDLEKVLFQALQGHHVIAMEYSPKNANPAVSVVDGGTLELVASLQKKMVSSDNLLQHFTSVLTEWQIQSHKAAAGILDQIICTVWDMIARRLKQNKKITDYDVQQFILSEFTANNCITEQGPICAINACSSEPHYTAKKEQAITIEPGDFILLDLWCKLDEPHSVYADVTQVAVAAAQPSAEQKEIFLIVRKAQQIAFEFIQEKLSQNQPVFGYQVDDVCRAFITQKGYGPYFLHRTGHNIDTHVHGAGANLDNLEISDHRQLLPSTCFSIEPGVYLPHKFGVRLEVDVVITASKQLEITCSQLEDIPCLM